MGLGVTVEVARADLFDASVIYVSLGNMSVADKRFKPLNCERFDFIVIDRH
jgi:hypothetical protein